MKSLVNKKRQQTKMEEALANLHLRIDYFMENLELLPHSCVLYHNT